MVELRRQAERAFFCGRGPGAPATDPMQDAEIPGEVWPGILLAGRVPGPVDMKDLWFVSQFALEVEPRLQIGRQRVPDECRNPEGVIANGMLAEARAGTLRAQSCTKKDTLRPIECLNHRWVNRVAQAAEQDGADGNPLGRGIVWVESGVVRFRGTETTIGV